MTDSEFGKLSDDELGQEIARVDEHLRKTTSMTGLFLLKRLTDEARRRSSTPKPKDKEQ